MTPTPYSEALRWLSHQIEQISLDDIDDWQRTPYVSPGLDEVTVQWFAHRPDEFDAIRDGLGSGEWTNTVVAGCPAITRRVGHLKLQLAASWEGPDD